MRVLHVTANPHDSRLAFEKAAEFSTGTVHQVNQKITWLDGSWIKFVSVQSRSDSEYLLGYSVSQIIIEPSLPEDIKALLHSLLREKLL